MLCAPLLSVLVELLECFQVDKLWDSLAQRKVFPVQKFHSRRRFLLTM
jgi:hypothetical protein